MIDEYNPEHNPFLDDDDDEDEDDYYEEDEDTEVEDNYADDEDTVDEDNYDTEVAADGKAPPGGSYASWLVSVILSLIPVAGLIYLFITKKRDIRKAKWARAMLSVELVMYMVLTIVFTPTSSKSLSKKSGSKTAVNKTAEKSIKDAPQKDTSQKNDTSQTGSKDLKISFSSGAEIALKMAEEYKESDTSKDKSSETVSYLSDSGKMLIAVCVQNAGSKDQTTKESIESLLPEGTKLKDFKTSKNEYMTVSTYAEVSAGGITTYKCTCVGEKGDYIVLSADEPITITSAGYV